MHFTMVMKVIMMMRVIMKIMNNSSYQRVSSIQLLQNSFTNYSTKTNDFGVCKHQKHFTGTLLLAEDVCVCMCVYGLTIWCYWVRRQGWPMSSLCTPLHSQVESSADHSTSLVYTEYVWKALFLRNRNRFCLNSKFYSEINSVCSNK